MSDIDLVPAADDSDFIEVRSRIEAMIRQSLHGHGRQHHEYMGPDPTWEDRKTWQQPEWQAWKREAEAALRGGRGIPRPPGVEEAATVRVSYGYGDLGWLENVRLTDLTGQQIGPTLLPDQRYRFHDMDLEGWAE